jgi:hypothetical protein
MDALKLLALRHALPDGLRVRFLLVVPEELTGRLDGNGWFSVAIRLAAEIIPVALMVDEKRRLSEATARQAQGQSRTARPGKDCGE